MRRRMKNAHTKVKTVVGFKLLIVHILVRWCVEISECFPQLTDNKPMSLFRNLAFSANCLFTYENFEMLSLV